MAKEYVKCSNCGEKTFADENCWNCGKFNASASSSFALGFAIAVAVVLLIATFASPILALYGFIRTKKGKSYTGYYIGGVCLALLNLMVLHFWKDYPIENEIFKTSVLWTNIAGLILSSMLVLIKNKETIKKFNWKKIGILLLVVSIVSFTILGATKLYEAYKNHEYEEAQLVNFKSSDIPLSNKFINNAIGTYNGLNSWGQFCKLTITTFNYIKNDQNGNVDYRIIGLYNSNQTEIKIDTIIVIHFNNDELLKLRQNKESEFGFSNFSFYFQKGNKVTLTFNHSKSIEAFFEETKPEYKSFHLFNSTNYEMKDVLFDQLKGAWEGKGNNGSYKILVNIKTLNGLNDLISFNNIKGVATVGLYEHSLNNGVFDLTSVGDKIQGTITLEGKEIKITGNLKGSTAEGVLYAEVNGKILIKDNNEEFLFTMSKGIKNIGTKNVQGIIDTNSGDNLKTNSEQDIIATFEGAEMGDYFHLTFKGEDGIDYDFGLGENNYCGYEFGEEKPNPKYLGKKFNIKWKEVMTKTYAGGGSMDIVEREVPTITSITIIKQ